MVWCTTTVASASELLFLPQRNLEKERQQFWRQFSTGTTTLSHEEKTLSMEDCIVKMAVSVRMWLCIDYLGAGIHKHFGFFSGCTNGLVSY